MAADMAAIVAAYALALSFAVDQEQSFAHLARKFDFYLAVLLVVWLVAAADQRLFSARRSEALVSLLFSLTRAFFVTALFGAFAIELLDDYGLERGIFVPFAVFSLLFILTVRLATGVGLWDLRRRGYSHRRILLVGANERSRNLVRVLKENEQFGYFIIGFLEKDEERVPLLESEGVAHLGDMQDLEHLLVDQIIDAVYIALPLRTFYEEIQSIAHLCEGVGVSVRFVADLFPLRMATSEVTRLPNMPLLSLTFDPEVQSRFSLKGLSDLMVAVALVLLLSPVLLLVTLAIRLGSSGPALVRRDGRLSFRTQAWHDGVLGEELGGFSALLRRYGLQELPRLIQVALGQREAGGPKMPGGVGKKHDVSV